MKKSKIKRLEEIYSEKPPLQNLHKPVINTYSDSHRPPNDELFHNLRLQLDQEWHLKNIPQPLCEVYLKFILSIPQRKSIIFMQKEISELRSYNSIVQLCLKGIFAREESLMSIKEMSEYLHKSPNWEEINDIKLECAEILHAHRMLTLNAAESIERWKDFFYFENNEFHADFLWNGRNYLEKMQNDLDFLRTSELAKVFKFSSESDPFLVFPSKIVENRKKGKGVSGNYFMMNGQVIIPLPSLIIKRVNRMEEFIKAKDGLAKAIKKGARNNRTVSPAVRAREGLAKEVTGKQGEMISKAIAEMLYRLEIGIQVSGIIKEQVNEVIAKSISVNMDGVIEKVLREIVEEAISDAKKVDDEEEKFNNELEGEKKRKVGKGHKREKADIKLAENYDREMEMKESHIGNFDEINDDQAGEHKTSHDLTLSSKKSRNHLEKSRDSDELNKHTYNSEKLPKTLNDLPTHTVEPAPKSTISPSIQSVTPISPPKSVPTLKPQSPTTNILLTKSSENAKRLQNFSIYESIIRNLIETLIIEVDLERISSVCLKEILDLKSRNAGKEEKRRLTIILKNIEEEKLQELIFTSIIESFVNTGWLEVLVDSLILNSQKLERRLTIEPFKPGSNLLVEEVIDYALEVFTPGVHSPNEIRSEEENSIEDSLKASDTGEGIMRLISEGRKNGKYGLQAFAETYKTGWRSLNDYYQNLKGDLLELNADLSLLKSSTDIAENCSYYWYRDSLEIIGCLVFSYLYIPEKTAVVHHISVTSQEFYKNILNAAIDLLKTLSFSKAIFQFTPSKSSEAKKILSKSKPTDLSFTTPWDTFPLHQSLIILQKSQSYSRFRLCLNASNTLTASNRSVSASNLTCAEMMRVANRHCTLSSILPFFATEDISDGVLSQTPSVRLQRDMIEILEIIASLNPFTYPMITSKLLSSNVSQSILDISISFKGASYFQSSINSIPYKMIGFTQAQVSKSEDQWVLYTVETSDEQLTAFFLVYPGLSKELKMELKGFKTDLFHKIDNVLKGLILDGERTEVAVPAFNVGVDWEVAWMHGFELKKQDDGAEEDLFVEKANEKVRLGCEGFDAAIGIMQFTEAQIVKGEFVFGLRHKGIEESLELPLFACLVCNEDWIKG